MHMCTFFKAAGKVLYGMALGTGQQTYAVDMSRVCVLACQYVTVNDAWHGSSTVVQQKHELCEVPHVLINRERIVIRRGGNCSC